MKSRVPKVLHRICGKEMVNLVVGTARQAGFSTVVVVVPPQAEAIRQAVGEGVRFAQQAEALGSGHALLQAREALHGVDTIAVLSGDVPLVRPETLSRLTRLHLEREACITLLTSRLTRPDGLGRVVRDSAGRIIAIVEESEADETTRAIAEINAGVYCFRTSWLWQNLGGLSPSAKGEIYLTDLVALAARQGVPVESIESADPHETLGVNNRVQLAEAEAVLRQRIREHWMLQGVTMPDPSSVYIDADVVLGQDTLVLPNTHIRGRTRIGDNCEIGPNSVIEDCVIASGCKVIASFMEGGRLDEGVDVGPFSHIRPGSHLERGVHIGNFAEVKNSRLGPESKSGHFSYIGDSDVGANVNIGAGTITCNYDGVRKNKTVIGDDAFIGSDTMLVAPVTIGPRSATGAGSVVTKDVPPDSLAVGVPARVLSRKAREKKDDQG